MSNSVYVEIVYIATGIILPLFYLPQIVKLYQDETRLASYSFSKATAQLTFRVPALLFAIYITTNVYMIGVVALDLFGRLLEWLVAIYSMKKQGCTTRTIALRTIPNFTKLSTFFKSKAPDSEAVSADAQTCRARLEDLKNPADESAQVQVALEQRTV